MAGNATSQILSDSAAEIGRERIRARAAGKNINQETLLATDYLNHFSEAIMLLEMAADMPDMLDELVDWKPLTYVEHFEGSTLAEADLMIEAYHLSPPQYRGPFDAAVTQLADDISQTLSEALVLTDEGNEMNLKSLLQSAVPELHKAADRIAAIVNTPCGDQQSQAEIDALFD